MDPFDYVKYENENSGLRSASTPIFSITKTSKKRTDSSFFIRVVRMSNLLIKQKIDICCQTQTFQKTMTNFFVNMAVSKFCFSRSCTWFLALA